MDMMFCCDPFGKRIQDCGRCVTETQGKLFSLMAIIGTGFEQLLFWGYVKVI